MNEQNVTPQCKSQGVCVLNLPPLECAPEKGRELKILDSAGLLESLG